MTGVRHCGLTAATGGSSENRFRDDLGDDGERFGFGPLKSLRTNSQRILQVAARFYFLTLLRILQPKVSGVLPLVENQSSWTNRKAHSSDGKIRKRPSLRMKMVHGERTS